MLAHLGFANNNVMVSLKGNVIFSTKPIFSPAGGQRLFDNNIVVSQGFCLKVKICTTALLSVFGRYKEPIAVAVDGCCVCVVCVW